MTFAEKHDFLPRPHQKRDGESNMVYCSSFMTSFMHSDITARGFLSVGRGILLMFILHYHLRPDDPRAGETNDSSEQESSST